MSLKSVESMYNQVVGDEGIKSDISLQLDDQTLRKLVLALLLTGVGIAFAAHLLKNVIRNKELVALRSDVAAIKNHLSK